MSEAAAASSPEEHVERAQARTRRCIVTGDVLPEARLLRFAADPGGKVVVDVEAKLPGRGLWVRSERAAVRRAVEKHLFARAAKASLSADADLDEQAEARLAERMLAQLGLAHRSGQLILGFDTVERTLRGGDGVAAVIQASDASAEGSRKLQSAAVAADLVPFVIGCFSGAELSLALGRANVVHAALKPGRMAERLIFDAGRLSGFRPLKSWIWVGFREGRAENGASFSVKV
jgi:predicted RNA-binding protein YlxR (DUF448 family)